ncbi:GNAT family N-acetyltransferase [Acanthopleuribacter pedis]|uniref:GNAT family N-acetyltransferase n=1 Tax=Acanthopleuribacter pedis TaxID=442870 RepID=A0A8J7QR54_9BACT|nr:GNAT family N-acetyltransferase [Acanthopleuribacter pedis]MBO1322675.1 GNAT family N-acetyltransferase [Acanthopleuribacter pedis]
MSAVRIGKAGPDQAVALQAFVERTFRDTYREHNTAEDMEQYVAESFGLDRVRAELHDADITYLILEKDHAVAGYAKLNRGEPTAVTLASQPNLELCRFYIDQPFHGQGLAQKLMEHCFAATRGQGYRGIWLGVWSQNHRALRYYAKEGFEKVGSQIFVLGRDEQLDYILYAGQDRSI